MMACLFIFQSSLIIGLSSAIAITRPSSLEASMQNKNLNFRVDTIGEHERSVFAAHDSKEGEVQIRVPWCRIVTSQKGRCTWLGQVASQLDKTTPRDYLACWLVIEATRGGKKTASDPNDTLYLDSLPSLYDLAHVPSLWQPEDIAFLQGSNIGRVLNERRQNDKLYLAQLLEAASNDPSIDFEAASRDITPSVWNWAQAIVRSRGFMVPHKARDSEGRILLNSGDDTSFENFQLAPVLVPLVDMINHRQHSLNCDWTIEEPSGAFVVYSLAPVKAGEEMTLSYSPALSASPALLNYGFVPEPADWNGTPKFDFAVVRVGLQELCAVEEEDEEDASIMWDVLDDKLSVWLSDEDDYAADNAQKGRETGDREVIVGVGMSGNGQTLLSLLRVAVANRRELDSMLTTSTSGGEPSRLEKAAWCIARNPNSKRNERAAIKLLADLLDRQLAEYPTTLQSDLALIAAAGMDDGQSQNRLNAARVVAGEKMAILHWKEIARKTGEMLASDSFDGDLRYKEELDIFLLAGHYSGTGMPPEPGISGMPS
mmetsp:Transcript_2632/g.5511  ORF Transcript_2632/g.5511 Transcript_2632/m.5511 type:complete len:542 (-) Transcript_2632:85-1710(-)